MMNPLAVVGRFWRGVQRNIDRRILFPELERGATSVEHYDRALLMHIGIDPAWRNPDEWMSDPDIAALEQRMRERGEL